MIVSLAYAAGSQLAFSWFGADGTSASFFPAAGVTLAALLMLPAVQWPYLLAAAGLTEVAMDLIHGIGLAPSLGYAAANVAQPLVAALLVRRTCRRVDLGRSRDLAVFLSFAVVVGPAAGAVLGATSYVVLDRGEGWARFAGEWWVGDGLGVLVVAGIVLAQAWASARPTSSLRRAEAVALVLTTAFSTFAVFHLSLLGAAYVPVALVLAIAFRAGTRGVAWAGGSAAFIAAQGTATGHRLWETLDTPPATGLLYLQLGMAVVLATAFALAAEINEQQRAAVAWANADSARRDAAAIAQRAERLRALAADLAAAVAVEDVDRALVAHGFGAEDPTGGDPILRDAAASMARQAIERAKLLEQARSAAQRSAFLVRYGAALAQPTNAIARARRAVRLLMGGPARHAAIYLVDDDLRPTCVARAGPGQIDERRATAVVEETLSGGTSHAVDLWVDAAADGSGRPQQVAGLPLFARDRVIGALVVEWGPGFQGRTDAQREIAGRTALAIEDAQLYERERRASHTLQRGLLGGPLHRPAGVELAAAYRPGTETLEVGGDWYDSFSLPSGRVAVVVGDVVGHSLEAAVAMGHLRGAVRALAPMGSPRELLERLDGFVAGLPTAAMATVAYLELDPASGAVCYSCAGHPPPLLVRADGAARYLWGGRSAPLGLSTPRRTEATAVLRAGDHVVLYTDGLVEKRTTSLEDGLAVLHDAFRPLPGRRLDDVVEATLQAMLPDGVQEDDVCLIVVAVTAATRSLYTTLGGLQDLAVLRSDLRTWLQARGVAVAVRDDIVLAVGEAAANAIEHGSLEGSGRRDPSADPDQVSVEATVDGGRLIVVVRDSGRWLDRPSAPDRGRGTDIMHHLVDDLTVDVTIGGTDVALRCDLQAR